MNEPIEQISCNSDFSQHQYFSNSVSVRSLTEPEEDNKKSSHKYVIENKLIAYEKYDGHGKLISRVPWSHMPIDKTA
jgi:hypothetical protein